MDIFIKRNSNFGPFHGFRIFVTNRQAEIIVNNLNNISINIFSILKTQLNNTIHFLDCTVTLINNKFELNILQKTNTKGFYYFLYKLIIL